MKRGGCQKMIDKDSSSVDILIASHMHLLSGGGELALMELIQHLHSKKYKLHVIIGAVGDFEDKLIELGIDYSIIAMPWWVRAPNDKSPYVYRTGNPNLNSLQQIVSLIKNIKPKLCMTNTMVIPWLAYASAITNTKHVWYIHEIGSGGQRFSYDIGEFQTLNTISCLSDGVFFNSMVTRSAYKKFINNDKFIGILYPFKIKKNHASVKNPYRSNGIKLISIGHIKPQKDQLTSVKSIKKLLDRNIKCELILVGGIEDHDYYGQICDYIKDNGLEKYVNFLGKRDDVDALIEHADIGIMSAQNEAFGRATVEIMSHGKLVIGADSGGTAEIIKDGHNGYLFEPGQALDLATKIAHIFNNPSLQEKLGKNAHSYVLDNFNSDSIYQPLVKYMDKIESIEKSALSLAPMVALVDDYEEKIIETDDYPLFIRRFSRITKRLIKKVF